MDGGEQYSIRSSGVVFTADDKGDLFDAMQRGRRRPRVGRDTLDGIKTQIEIIQSLAISGEDALNAYRKGRRGLVTSVQFHVDYSGTLGGGVFDEYRSKQNHWGGHETEFEKLIQLVNQALQEAQQEVLI